MLNYTKINKLVLKLTNFIFIHLEYFIKEKKLNKHKSMNAFY